MSTKSRQPATITVHVPLRFTTRGNTKRIVGTKNQSRKLGLKTR